MLLFFDSQNSDAVLFTVAAGMKELPDGIAPVKSGLGYQAAGVFDEPGLLKVEGFHDNVFFCREKGIKERSGNPYGLIYLFYGSVLDTLLCHQLQSGTYQGGPDSDAVFFGISCFRHGASLKK